MCGPFAVPLTQLAITAVSAAAAHDQQRRSSNIAQDNLDRQQDLEQNDLARQQVQIHEAATAEANEHARRASADMALFDAVAGEYGGGNSVNSNRAAMGIQQGEGLATIQRNASLQSSEAGFASLASRVRYQGASASIERPSWLQTGLKIGGAAATAYGQYKGLQIAKSDGQQPKAS